MREDDQVAAARSQPTGPVITVVSTFTTDCFPAAAGQKQERPGGPAFYIGAALRKLGCRVSILTGERPVVEVLLRPGGEHYRIPALRTIALPACIGGDAVILSPIMREVDPLTVGVVPGMLVLDIQGFVREPDIPSGEESGQINLYSLLRRADVVKAAASELARLDEPSAAALDRTLLVVTKGAQGAELRYDGRSVFITAQPVVAHDTVGAGDCFLASMVYHLIQDADPETAAARAARFTEDELSQRQ